ncbi:MAG: MalY/PatB family protein [bacterium]
MKFDFDTVINRRRTKSIKWDFADSYFKSEDLLPMWVADMDFPAPPVIIDRLKERAEHGAFGYTGYTDSFYESVIDWMKERHDWNIEKNMISTSSGVVTGLATAILALTSPGDEIIVQPPVYYPFFSIVKNNGRQLLFNELKREGSSYIFDLENIKSLISSRTKALILCSPHNPVGRVWTENELTSIAEICADNNIMIFSDEIHMDVVYPPHKHNPLASLGRDISDITITFTAPSKTFNTAGLSQSLVISSNEDMLTRYNNRRNALGLMMGNTFGIEALETAYSQGGPWLDELLLYLKANRDFITDFVTSEMDMVKPIVPEGTYLYWLDFSGTGMDDKAITNKILHKAGIALDYGTMFGMGGRYHQRINFACPRSILAEGLEKISKQFKRS